MGRNRRASDRIYLASLAASELDEMAEGWADSLRDLAEIAGEGSGDPEYWLDAHGDYAPMPARPRSRAAWKRHDARVAEADRWLVLIGDEMDRRP